MGRRVTELAFQRRLPHMQVMSILFDQTDFSVVVKNRALASETVEMGNLSGRSEQPNRMFIGPL